MTWIYTQQIRMNDETKVPTATETLNGHNGHEDIGDMTDEMNLDEMADQAEQQEMQRLLDAEEGQFKTIKRGDVVEGQIVHMDADEILVDIASLNDGADAGLSLSEASTELQLILPDGNVVHLWDDA